MKLTKPAPRANPDHFRVKVVELPSRSVAYIRVSNPYQGDAVVQAARRLVAWAESKNVADSQWLGYQFESPRVTALEHCHYCAAVEVDVEFKPKDEVGFYRFPKMMVAEVEMRGGIDFRDTFTSVAVR